MRKLQHNLLFLPSRLPGFMGLGLVFALPERCALPVYTTPAPSSGVRDGSKCVTSCHTFRHRVGAVLLLGWRWLPRWWLCLR
jgi:hypothetical protein